MNYIIKEHEHLAPEVTEKPYDFYELQNAEDAEGNIIKIKKFVGTFKKSNLENEKARLQEQIAKIDEKINLINNSN